MVDAWQAASAVAWERVRQSELDPSQCWLSETVTYRQLKVAGAYYTLTRLLVASRDELDYFDRSWVTRHMCPGGGDPRCWNPEHLTNGSHSDNARDAVVAGRRDKVSVAPQRRLERARRTQHGASKYHGVSVYKNVRWMASLTSGGRLVRLGYYDSEIDAALAYDAGAERLRPTAMLNRDLFPEVMAAYQARLDG